MRPLLRFRLPAQSMASSASPARGANGISGGQGSRCAASGTAFPVLFVCELLIGLPLALYTCKAASLVVWQRRLIYLPWLPPGARTHQLKDIRLPADIIVKAMSVVKEERHIDGLTIRSDGATATGVHTLLFYLQGNTGTPLNRLPIFEALYRSLKGSDMSNGLLISAFAPTGWWTSSRGKITQSTLLRDYSDAASHMASLWPRANLVLYGHSLGASAAAHVCNLLTEHGIRVAGVILEAPVLSIPDMLRATYPQRWLPYRYCGPFAIDRFDTARAVAEMSPAIPLLVLQCGEDEVIPPSMCQSVLTAAAAKIKGLHVVQGALHQNAHRRRGWAESIVGFLRDIVPTGGPGEHWRDNAQWSRDEVLEAQRLGPSLSFTKN